VEAVRVRVGLKYLAGKHASTDLEEAWRDCLLPRPRPIPGVIAAVCRWCRSPCWPNRAGRPVSACRDPLLASMARRSASIVALFPALVLQDSSGSAPPPASGVRCGQDRLSGRSYRCLLSRAGRLKPESPSV
jgi:hypothetical protein